MNCRRSTASSAPITVPSDPVESRENKQEWTYDEYVALTSPSPLTKFIRKALNLVARLTVFPRMRLAAYRLMGIHVGKGVFIGPDCYLDDTFPELIHIEQGVTVSFRVTIAVHGATRRSSRVAPVLVREGAFIGTGAVILSGVSVGRNAIVGAGAVVTKDVPDGACVAGVPARILDEEGEL